jgi:hypothetical protein
LRALTNVEADEDDLYNDDEAVRALDAINQPLDLTSLVNQDDEIESMDESDELSLIGEDLVNQSLAEVTALLDQNIDTKDPSMMMEDQNSYEKRSKTTKRISFLVPSNNNPRIAVSSADDGSQFTDY